MKKIISKIKVDNTVFIFTETHQTVSLTIVPASKEQYVNYEDNDATDGMVQLAIAGDIRFNAYSSGDTMRNSQTTNTLRYIDQKTSNDGNFFHIDTYLRDFRGLDVVSHLKYDKQNSVIVSYNELTNDTENDVLIEKFDSFSISGITPYADGKSDLRLYKMFGNWSAEGRINCQKIECIGLEQSWANYGIRVERINAIGSMPIKRYFPFICIEDQDYNTLWGVYSEAPYSWDIEVSRYNRYISISGGTEDFEHGHYRKKLCKGEKYVTTKAYLTVCDKTPEDVYNNLRHGLRSSQYSEKEKDIPIIYNEYCHSWGNPTESSVIRSINKAKELGAEYYVIDAGWYCENKSGNWDRSIGDYIPYEKSFPNGIKHTADILRSNGLIPGIWFEFECVSIYSDFYKNHPELLLKKDGNVIISGSRAFLDFRKKEVRTHLKEIVIDFLHDNGFGYIKIDYNECLGLGCDGAESYGAALESNMKAVTEFIEEIRSSIPDVIIEICSSGGHRLEPWFLERCDMVSFSDAHECHEGAIVAANVNRLVPTYKNQIWGVVNNNYSEEEIRYSLVKTLYGRLCISGNIVDLSNEKYNIVSSFTDFYNSVKYILKNDRLIILTDTSGLKYLDPAGTQASLKISEDRSGALLIVHGFKNSTPFELTDDLLTDYEIESVFSGPNTEIIKADNRIRIALSDFDATAIHLKKKKK